MELNFDTTSPETLKASALAALSGTVETREGSFADLLLSAWAYQAYKNYQLVPAILELAFPTEASGDLIDQRAADFGLSRVAGTKAAVTLRFTARAGAPEIPAGTVAVTADGLRFETTAPAEFSGLTADVPAEAECAGRAYNVDAGSVLYLVKNIAGVASVTNPEAAEGGTDEESDSAFLARYKAYMRRTAASGSPAYYEGLALEVSGVGNVYCEPLWNGAGTARVVLAGPDKEALSESVVSAAKAHLEEGRMIGCSLTVVSVTELPVNVAATVTLAAGASVDDVATELTLRLSEYLLGLPFGTSNLLRVSKVLSLLLDCEGVDEYSGITLNEGTANLTAGRSQTMVAGAVSLTVAQ